MIIDEFEFQDRNGNEIEPTKNQLVIYIKSLHKQITELQKQLEEKNADIIALDVDNYSFKQQIDNLRQQLKTQPAEIVEKIRKELGLKLKYKLNDEVSVLKICNKINEVLDTILKEYQK